MIAKVIALSAVGTIRPLRDGDLHGDIRATGGERGMVEVLRYISCVAGSKMPVQGWQQPLARSSAASVTAVRMSEVMAEMTRVIVRSIGKLNSKSPVAITDSCPLRLNREPHDPKYPKHAECSGLVWE